MCIQNSYYNYSCATGVLLPPILPCVCNSTNVNHFLRGLQPPAIATPVTSIPFLPKTFHCLTTDSFWFPWTLTLNPRFPDVPSMADGYHSTSQQEQQHHQLTSSLPLSPQPSADAPFAVLGVTPSPSFLSAAFSCACKGNTRPPISYSALVGIAMLSFSKKMLTLVNIISGIFPCHTLYLSEAVVDWETVSNINLPLLVMLPVQREDGFIAKVW